MFCRKATGGRLIFFSEGNCERLLGGDLFRPTASYTLLECIG
jgi:hypothetical protein